MIESIFNTPPEQESTLLRLDPEVETKLNRLIALELNFSTDVADYLNFDPLVAAEHITGKSYKEDADTSQLGLLLRLAYSKQMKTLLGIMGDTTFSNTYGDYVETLVSEGFTRVLQIPFPNQDPEGGEDNLEIWWNPEGVLLRFDTYRVDKINGANFYYNWVPSPEVRENHSYHDYISSGCLSGPEDAPVWVGSHDAREALRHNLRQLREHGNFLPTWIEPPFLWLMHHQDQEDYKEVNQTRIAMLPENVQAAIRGLPEVPRPEGKTL